MLDRGHQLDALLELGWRLEPAARPHAMAEREIEFVEQRAPEASHQAGTRQLLQIVHAWQADGGQHLFLRPFGGQQRGRQGADGACQAGFIDAQPVAVAGQQPGSVGVGCHGEPGREAEPGQLPLQARQQPGQAAEIAQAGTHVEQQAGRRHDVVIDAEQRRRLQADRWRELLRPAGQGRQGAGFEGGIALAQQQLRRQRQGGRPFQARGDAGCPCRVVGGQHPQRIGDG